MFGQNSALLVIDIQKFYFPGGDLALEEPEKAAENAKLLIDNFRARDDLIIYIRHNYEPGGDISEIVKPNIDELVIVKNNVNAFLNTQLDSALRSNEISELVLCGMQTHMCLEAATRAASDLGYKCTVIGDACATRALKYNDKLISAKEVHNSTLASLKSYASIHTTHEFIAEKQID